MKTMKVLFLNVFEGCQDKARLERIAAFVRKQNPDVLGLSEAVRWEEGGFAKLKEFQKLTGLGYSIFCKASSGYNLALLSKSALVEEANVVEGFKCGLLKAKFTSGNAELRVLLTHLHSRSEDLRLKEIELIANYVNPNENELFIGDLNSLSPLDEYNEKEIVAEARRRKLTKFGENSLRREVISKVMGWGFVDLVKKFSKEFGHSMPTPSATEEEKFKHFTNLRLDYAFASPVLASKVKSAAILRTEETSVLSDHYPVIVEISL